MIDVIAFDGDDTLWHSESVFAMTHERFRSLLEPFATAGTVDSRLLAAEATNLKLFGYGVKAFTLSMIETAIDLSEGRIRAADIQVIIDAGKAMLEHPVQLLDGVRETIDDLALGYRLMLVTKGDLFHQESKIARSGLADRFWQVAVVAEKDAPTYRRLLDQHGIEPARFLMVGNSVQSDVLPVVQVGARAVHVPYEITWALDGGEPLEGHDRVWRIDRVADLPRVLADIDAAS